MRHPKILYKYMKNCHATNLLTMGIFRVGTLYDFRNCEHGAEISDVNEGILRPTTYINNETLIYDSRPELRGLINISSGGEAIVRNTCFKSKHESKNYYLYCFSDRFNPSLYAKFDADSCLIITDPERFMKAIYEAIVVHTNDNMRNHLEPIKYINKNESHKILQKYHPALTKDLKFKDQAEWRCLWDTIADHIQPFVTANYHIIKFCRLYHTLNK